MVTPGVRVLRGVVSPMDAAANRHAVRREHRVGAILAVRGLRCQGASAEDDPPVPAWPVSAGAAPFGSRAIWAEAAPAGVESGAHSLLWVIGGWEQCCEAWLLLRGTVHWASPAGGPDGWGRGWEQVRPRVEVSAAGVPGIGVQRVSEEAASERVPCEPASAPAPPVSARLSSVVQMPGVRQVWRERQAAQAVAGEMRRHGLGPLELEPVLAAPA